MWCVFVCLVSLCGFLSPCQSTRYCCFVLRGERKKGTALNFLDFNCIHKVRLSAPHLSGALKLSQFESRALIHIPSSTVRSSISHPGAQVHCVFVICRKTRNNCESCFGQSSTYDAFSSASAM